MFLIALLVVLYMFCGYIYMLLLLNRTKVCLQSICSQRQENGWKRCKNEEKGSIWDFMWILCQVPLRKVLQWVKVQVVKFISFRIKRKIKESRTTTEKQVIRKSPRKRFSSHRHPIGRRPQPIRMEWIWIYREDQPIGRPFYPIGWKSLLTHNFFIKDCDFINPVLGPSFQYSNHSILLGEQEKHLCT
jgi:hypothetical protein